MNTSKSKWIPVVLYSILILYITIFSRTPGSERIVKGLFWEVQVGYWRDILLNILLFLPLGFLFGVCFKNWKAVLLGFLLSALIELTQYVLFLGYCEADDVLNNVIGTAVGFGIHHLFSVLVKKWKNKQVVKA